MNKTNGFILHAYLNISSARQYSQRNKFLANIYQPQFSDNIMD